MNDLWFQAFTCEVHNGNHSWKFTPSSKLLETFHIYEEWSSEIPNKYPKEWKAFLLSLPDAFSKVNPRYKTTEDILYRKNISSTNIDDSTSEKAISYWLQQQNTDGHWPADYGGPLFLIPGFVIAMYICETPMDEVFTSLMIQYLFNHQDSSGAWSLHIGGEPSMFSTVLQYVSLRLLGVDAHHEKLQLANAWIHINGSITQLPHWGKFYLCLLGLYKYEGMHAVLPELYLLPDHLPVHPSKLWCHTRMVYLPMAYLCGIKFCVFENELIKELRTELYGGLFHNINWKHCRNQVHETDAFVPLSKTYKLVAKVMNFYDMHPVKHARAKSLAFLEEQIQMEDENTQYINLGPVNKFLNLISTYVIHGKNSTHFKQHLQTVPYYLWLAEDGLKVQGYNGSQLWDTAFSLLALSETKLPYEHLQNLHSATSFVKAQRINSTTKNHTQDFRNQTKGGWPFSTKEQGWTVSDCTAEALLAIAKTEGWECFTDSEWTDSLQLILSMQNKDGGFSSYEAARTGSWLEQLNPASIFGDIMTDFSYVECTSSCLQILMEVYVHKPNLLSQQILHSIQTGIGFLLKQQQKDGSWYGSWGVCFTYGTWFAIEALVLYSNAIVKTTETEIAIQKAVEFIKNKQNPDGGWGESYKSCMQKKYIPCSSQIVQTSWAVLTLLKSGLPCRNEIDRGIQFIEREQRVNGDWPQQQINGQFNKSCMISYSCYRNIFPIWALARYENMH